MIMKDFSTTSLNPCYLNKKESKVAFADCELQTFMSDRRPGITVIDYSLESPACFWIDSSHVYLRVNWSQWCTVSLSSPNHIAALCATSYCRITHSQDNEISECLAPVFHIEELPRELFDSKFKEDQEEDEDDDSEFLTKEIWQTQVQDFQAMETAVDTALEVHGGLIVSRHRGFGKYGCDLDVAMVGGKCLLISYFCESGTWLPEEKAFGGDPPLYFSECDHCVSPVFVAKGFGDYFKERLKGGSVVTILVVSTGCEFLDEEKFVVIWRDNCHVEAVRTERVAGSQLESLHEYLDSLSAREISSELLDIEKVKAIDSDLTCANPT